MKEFADLQKRPDKVPEPPVWKPLQTNDIWPKPKKKVAGYGPGGYGKTALGFRKFSVYELATGVRPETLIEQAAASSGSEALAGQKDTWTAQGGQGDVKESPTTNVGSGHEPLAPTSPIFPVAQPPIKVAQASITAPARTQPRLQDPLIRQPLFPKSGAPSGQPQTGQPLNRPPAGDPTMGDPMTGFIEGVKAGEATVGSVRQSFGNRLPDAALGMPSGFLEAVNGQWNSVTQHKTFTATGAQVADPNYPPTAQQTLQVWNAAWANWAKDSAQLPPEGQKEYARAYQNYLQVQKTLQEQAAAETWAGQALTSLKSSPKASKATQPEAKTKPSAPTPLPKQPTAQEIQQDVETLKAHQNQEAEDLLNRQSKERKDAEAKRQQRDAADGAKDARQKIDQQKQKRINQTNYDATINSISQTTDAKINAMHRTFHEAKLTISLEGVPPEQQPQVMQKAAQLYRQKNNGKPYNLSNPKDPENDPLMLSQMVEWVRAQGGIANVPVVMKPEGLPKPAQKQGDKTLPIQTKKPGKQQGSFVPQPLPEVKPKSEGEPDKDDPNQVQLVTSKINNSPTSKPGQSQNAKGQKKGKKKTSSDYRKNFEDANGPIPDGHQVHHRMTQASAKKSELAQRWKELGIADVHDPDNLEALPQTKEAYDKSSVKIQHSGSHPKWNEHVDGILEKEQERLETQYGSLDKVPTNVMEKTKDKFMQNLREDLLDKDLGIERGWIKRTKKGMDKLSKSEILGQIG